MIGRAWVTHLHKIFLKYSIIFKATIAACFVGMLIYAAPAQAQQASAGTSVDVPQDQADATDSTDESATALAKKLQNPIGNLYSFPFQSNTNFNYGPNKGTQENLHVQPVIPIHVNSDWTVILRAILPLIWQPSLEPMHTVPFGTGATTLSAFVAPASPSNGWLWGAGPVVQIPTISSATLGSNVWGGGPTGVLVYMKGPIVAGALANNIWSFGGTSGPAGTRYNNFLVQPFFNYNFGDGWYVGSSPIINANWLTSGNNAWTLPIGANAGRVIKIGKIPVNLSAGAYGNVLRPQYGATWQLRTQITFIF
jgi:hypothetical protein